MIIKRKPKTEEDRAKALIKEREKRRKKMIRTKYGQAPLKHAKKGVYSCIYAVVVFLLLLLMMIHSYISKGEVGLLICRTWYPGVIRDGAVTWYQRKKRAG